MENTINFDYNNKAFANNTVAVMKDLLASNEYGSSMDDAYKAVCKYANITREQFDDYYQQAETKLESWKNSGLFSGKNCELNEEDLDMVVGGGISEFISTVKDALSSAVDATGNFLTEHAATISLVAGVALTLAGVTMLLTGNVAGSALIIGGIGCGVSYFAHKM